MTMTPRGRALLKQWEGERLYVYDDATGKRLEPGDPCIGTPTAGVGHTGPDVVPGMAVTRAMSDAWLDADIAEAARHVDRAVRVALTPGPRDACISLVFNIGPGRKGVRDGFVELRSGKPSSVLRAINEQRWDDVPELWAKWNRAGGKVSKGLVKRRAAELAELWVIGEPRSVAVDPPRPKPALLDPSVIPAVATGVAGTIVAVKQITDAVTELSASLVPTYGATIAIAFASVVAVAGTVFWGIRIYQRREAEKA